PACRFSEKKTDFFSLPPPLRRGCIRHRAGLLFSPPDPVSVSLHKTLLFQPLVLPLFSVATAKNLPAYFCPYRRPPADRLQLFYITYVKYAPLRTSILCRSFAAFSVFFCPLP